MIKDKQLKSAFQHIVSSREKKRNNIIYLCGQVGSEVKYVSTMSGRKKAYFNVSTKNYFENKSGQKELLWHSIVAWGTMADNVTEYLKIGDLVFITGRIHCRKYTDKNNQQKIFTEVVVEQFNK